MGPFQNILESLRDEYYPCYWDDKVLCRRQKDCTGCEHQPPDNEKPNGMAAPIHIHWKILYDCPTPFCPSCGEVPHSLERCVFCGQKFLPDKTTEEWNKPPKIVRMSCPMCGGKNTMVGKRAQCNGHFRGICENCGCEMME